MLKLLSTIIKIAVASLIVGGILSYLDISAAELLTDLGVTPETVFVLLQKGAEWAIPNIILGSLVIVPVWVVIYLFRPPRG